MEEPSGKKIIKFYYPHRIIILAFLAILQLASSINLECSYFINQWGSLGTIYLCPVKDPFEITSRADSTITSVDGLLTNEKGNDDVRGLVIREKKVHYFPQRIDKYFKNLEGFALQDCQLKEVHQSDLAVFPKLIDLYLTNNDITVLEEGLFDFNPNLKILYLYNNRISRIYEKVFDNLNKLHTLWLQANYCIGRLAESDRDQVQELIQVVKEKCSRPQ